MLEEQLSAAQEDLEDTQMEHLFKLETEALDDFINDLEDTLNDANETIYHTFEEFANTVQTLIDESALKDTSGSLQKIVDLLTGTTNSTIATDLASAVQAGISGTTVTGDIANGNLTDVTTTSSDTQYVSLLKATNVLVSDIKDIAMDKLSNLYDKVNSIDTNLSTIANSSVEVKITNNYDSLLNVEGSVDATVVSNLNKLLQQSYQYTSERMIKDLNSLGFYRRY